MYRDHEFDPVTPEEEARRAEEEEFARRVRREVRRMERGEADEDIRADEEREADERHQHLKAAEIDSCRHGVASPDPPHRKSLAYGHCKGVHRQSYRNNKQFPQAHIVVPPHTQPVLPDPGTGKRKDLSVPTTDKSHRFMQSQEDFPPVC